MAVNRSFMDRQKEFTSWWQELHLHTEVVFEETWKSDYVVGKLGSFGFPVHRGLART